MDVEASVPTDKADNSGALEAADLESFATDATKDIEDDVRLSDDVKKEECSKKVTNSSSEESPNKSLAAKKARRSPKGPRTKTSLQDKSPTKKTYAKKKDQIIKAVKRKLGHTAKEEGSPKPKLAKKISKKYSANLKLEQSTNSNISTSQENNTPKPKRKYVRKIKVQQQPTTICTDSATSQPDKLPSPESHTLPSTGTAVSKVKNGAIATNDVTTPPVKVRQKPGPKKGSKRKPKTAPESSKTSTAIDKPVVEVKTVSSVDAGDSDTVDYSVSSVLNSKQSTLDSQTQQQAQHQQPEQQQPQPPAQHQSHHKQQKQKPAKTRNVVKIDNIEITELSDLNSSRDESAEENDSNPSRKVTSVRERTDGPPPPTFINISECEQEDKSFLCSYPNCKYRGKNRVGMRKHLSHHQIYLCAHCDYHCNVYAALETHMVANHPQRWGRKKCKKCQRYIKGEIYPAHALVCDGTTQFACELCVDKVFKYESKLHDHERKCHANIKCELCDHVADTKTLLHKHMTVVHPKPKKARTKKPVLGSSKVTAARVAAPVDPAEHDSDSLEAALAAQLLEESQKVVYNAETGFVFAANTPTPTPPPAATAVVAGTVLLSPLDDTPEKAASVIVSSALCMETTPTMTSMVDTTVRDDEMDSSITNIPLARMPSIAPQDMHISADSATGHVTLSIPDSSSVTTVLGGGEGSAGDTAAKGVCSDTATAANGINLLMSPDSTTPMLYPPPREKQTVQHVCDVTGCEQVLKTYRLLLNHRKNVHQLTTPVMHPCDHPDCNLVFKKKGQLKKHQVVHTGTCWTLTNNGHMFAST